MSAKAAGKCQRGPAEGLAGASQLDCRESQTVDVNKCIVNNENIRGTVHLSSQAKRSILKLEGPSCDMNCKITSDNGIMGLRSANFFSEY